MRAAWENVLAPFLLASQPLAGQAPETVEDLGPGNGDWDLDYVGQFGSANGSGDERQHSGQSFYGVTDWLALGGETQLSYRSGPGVRQDRLYFDYDSAIAIIRFSDAKRDPVGLGLWLQAGLDSDGELARLEARLLAEKRTPDWWAQANLMLRRIHDERQEGGLVAYTARLRRSIGPSSWIGVESSGQALELGDFEREAFDKAHFLGPHLMHEVGLTGDDKLQLGVSYLRRLDHHRGTRGIAQVTIGLEF